jgi:hypothetical protein
VECCRWFWYISPSSSVFALLTGSECECVACEDIEDSGDIVIPPKPTDWGKDKEHWFCTDVGQKGWRSHQLNAKWIQACLMFLGHPGKSEVLLSTKAVAEFVARQGLSF